MNNVFAIRQRTARAATLIAHKHFPKEEIKET